MLYKNQITLKIEEINTLFKKNEKVVEKMIGTPAKILEENKLFEKAGIEKAKGVPVIELFIDFVAMKCKKMSTIFAYIKAKNIDRHEDLKKDTKDRFYQFLNNPNHNWRKLLLLFVSILIKLRKKHREELIYEDETALILDDTTLQKTGKKIENVSMVFDHNLNKVVLGFKGLCLAFHDGMSSYFLNFSLHRESKNKNYGLAKKHTKAQYKKVRPPESHGQKRIEESEKTKIEVGLVMIERALKEGFKADYVLVDSWFFNKQFVSFFFRKDGKKHSRKPDFIAMAPLGSRVSFLFKGSKVSSKMLQKILKAKKKRPTRNRQYNAYYYEELVSFYGMEVKVFYIRFSKRGKWRLLVTSNRELKINQVLRIYSKRWCIEVMFKEAKQLLHFDKCQSRDFDGQIAYISLCFIFYNYLVFYKSCYSYCSIGALFREIVDCLIKYTVAMKIWKEFVELLAKFGSVYEKLAEALSDLLFESGFFTMKEELTRVLVT